MNTLVKFICLALVGSALLHTTSAFARLDRSIKHCIETKNVNPDKCNELCVTQMSETESKSPLKVELKYLRSECCCKYDDYWEIEEIDKFNSQLMGKLEINPHDCKKLFLSRSTKEEKKAYKTMCLYHSSRKPLTMLQLADYIEAMNYLQSIKPKSSTIKKQVNEFYMPKYTTEMQQLIEKNLDSLLDHKRNVKNPVGPPFEIEQIEKLTQLTQSLRESFKSGPVDRAFDELIISRVMISVIGAEKFYQSLNAKVPYGILRSLGGKGGVVDASQVEFEGFSCEKFIPIRDNLTNLLEASRLALISLKIKGVFDEMETHWNPMSGLIEAIKIYNNLIGARCPDA